MLTKRFTSKLSSVKAAFQTIQRGFQLNQLAKHQRVSQSRLPFMRLYSVQRALFSSTNGTDSGMTITANPDKQQTKDDNLSYTFNSDEIKGIKYNKEGLLLMAFTCNVCQNKQARTFSKYAYRKGVVLIRCEGCDSLHLIADNLGFFRDQSVNIEQIMKEKGQDISRFVNNETMEFIQKTENELSSTKGDEKDEEHQHHEGCGHDHQHGNEHQQNVQNK